MKPNYMAIDQHGQTFHNLGPHPRKALLERLGRARAAKAYADKADGITKHIGWIVAGHWLTVYEVRRMEGES